MKKKKILGLTLAGMTALTGGFMLAGCDLKIHKDSTSQEQEMPAEKTISGISISASAVPKYIVKGRFDQAKIKAMVTYSDNSFEYITVTEDLLSNADKAKVQTAGTHSITVTYEGKTEVVDIEVVTEEQLLKHVVNDTLLSDHTQTIKLLENGEVVKELDYSYDVDKNVECYESHDEEAGETNVSWAWLNGNIHYVYTTEGQEVEVTKSLGRSMEGGPLVWLAMELDEIDWSVGVNSDNNYEATGGEYKVVFNASQMMEFEYFRDGHWLMSISMNPVNLVVPEYIKALESTASVNTSINYYQVGYRVLKEDFKIVANWNDWLQYDVDNNIVWNINDNSWTWVNGESYYIGDGTTAEKDSYNHSNFLKNLADDILFGIHVNQDEATFTITEDGLYYEMSCLKTFNGVETTIKYTFNEDTIIKIECDGDWDANANELIIVKTDIDLTVPDDIKALESSAVEGITNLFCEKICE